MSVPTPTPYESIDTFVDVGGFRTHYFEAGSGPTVVALHGGEHGCQGDISWEYNIAELAKNFRVVVPDWLGYGQTAKIHDFENFYERMVVHIKDFLAVMKIEDAVFLGNSMGANFLLRDAAQPTPHLKAKAIVAISGGGAVVDSMRYALTDYDGSREAMVTLVGALLHDKKWIEDEAYVDRRLESSLLPGAWECAAAARFRAPVRVSKGTPDIDYSKISVPVYLVSGQQDSLKPAGYAKEVQAQIKGSQLLDMPGVGHCAQIENPDAFHEVAIPFITQYA